ncbi:MAG: hypothetical protein GQ558_06920 [Thermoplasmata archaeon]|nr:hypothetical protein [Thermoplasmata archaeon]
MAVLENFTLSSSSLLISLATNIQFNIASSPSSSTRRLIEVARTPTFTFTHPP